MTTVDDDQERSIFERPLRGPRSKPYVPRKKGDQEKLAKLVLELRLQGLTYRSITKKTGLGMGTVQRYLKVAWEEITLPHAEEHRKYEIELVDQLLQELRVIFDDDTNPRADRMMAADKILKALTHRSRLTGSEMPIKYQAEVTEIPAAEAEILQVISDRAAEVKALERQIKRGDPVVIEGEVTEA